MGYIWGNNTRRIIRVIEVYFYFGIRDNHRVDEALIIHMWLKKKKVLYSYSKNRAPEYFKKWHL